MITAQMFRVCHRMFVLLLLVISNYFHFLFEPIDLHTYSYRIWLLILSSLRLDGFHHYKMVVRRLISKYSFQRIFHTRPGHQSTDLQYLQWNDE